MLVLAQCAFYFNDYEIADPSALVNRVYRLMSKELGVDPDAPLEEDAHDEKGDIGALRTVGPRWSATT